MPNRLESLPLLSFFPPRRRRSSAVLRVREVQDLLSMRGINLAEHRFSGSSQIVLTSAVESVRADQSLTSSAVKRAHRRV